MACGFVLVVSMALCVAASSDVTSADKDLQELKMEAWDGFMEMIHEIQGQMDTYDTSVDFKEFFKPVAEKHGAGFAKKIQDFKEKHPEADISAQSLIALSTEQTEQLKSSSKFTVLCPMARPVLWIGASMFCTTFFGWNLDFFNIMGCWVSFQLPFEAVCNFVAQALR